MIRKIADFIGKDTSSSEESKALLLVVRVLLLTVIAYFTLNILICSLALSFSYRAMIFYAVFLAVFAGIFFISYYRTFTALCMFYFGMVVWIISILVFFGWNNGVQHFLIVLLVLFFFSCYEHYLLKILFATAICVLRLLLFYRFQAGEPLWYLTETANTVLQILNSITIFWCISLICFVFSKNSQQMERTLKEYNIQLQQQANTDMLTGLYNRRKAMSFLTELSSDENPDKIFSLCICDIDFFKHINDQFGHDLGDLVLQKLAELFLSEKGKDDFVARWGGEEFLLVFPGCCTEKALEKLNRLRGKLKQVQIDTESGPLAVTMTFGLAEYSHSLGLNATIKEADRRLYIGKELGRDRIIYEILR
ncbi:MAG: GGDEF domain-containing protein [Candidatus Choladocola sp.]|nr:GGDEF domain-containing protein [Candidatus Choladocola sp.]